MTTAKAPKPPKDDKPSRADLAAATRADVVAAARRLFEKRGFESVTIRDVAAAAGMSTGAIFCSFDGKASLFVGAFPTDHRRRRVAEGACNAFHGFNIWASGSSALRDRWLAVADDIMARPSIAQSRPEPRAA